MMADRQGHTAEERVYKGNPTHGGRHTRAYSVWAGMKTRCLNPNSEAYKDYGGRGITVCESWLDFENFWRDMGDPPDGYTLERKDVNGGYDTENCCWIPKWKQGRNTRASRWITYNGETLCLAEWADRLHIPYRVLQGRLHNGKSFEESVAMGWGGEIDRRIRAALAAVEGIETETLETLLDHGVTLDTSHPMVKARADEAERLLALSVNAHEAMCNWAEFLIKKFDIQGEDEVLTVAREAIDDVCAFIKQDTVK